MNIYEQVEKIANKAIENEIYEKDNVNVNYVSNYMYELHDEVLDLIMEKINEKRNKAEIYKAIKILTQKDVKDIIQHIKKKNHTIIYRKKDENNVITPSELWYIDDKDDYLNIYDYYVFYIDPMLNWRFIEKDLVEALSKEDYIIEV